MKKVTLFVCALATAVATFAATPRNHEVLNATRARDAKMESMQFEPVKPAVFKTVEEAKADADTTILVRAWAPDAFHYGSNPNGPFYYTAAWYVTPFLEKLNFYNYYDEALWPASWILNDEDSTVLAANVGSYSLELEDGLGYYMGLAPVMRPNVIDGADRDTIIPAFQYGKGGIADWESVAGKAAGAYEQYKGVLNGDPYINPITKCNLYTEVAEDWYFPFDYGTFGAAAGGDYWYGTKLTNTYTSTASETKYMDTIATIISNPGVIYIDHITVGVWTRADGGADMFPGDDDHVRLTIYPLDANDNPDWSDPIATATAGRDQLTNGAAWTDFLEFHFLEEDPITHNSDTVAVTVEGDFAIVFDEFNDGTAAFGFLSDGYSDYDNLADTYFYFYYPAANRVVGTTRYISPANLLVNLYAYFPIVLDAPEVVNFKKGEALTQTITLTTNTWGESYDIDADDWIDVEAETIYDENDDHAYKVELTITVEASDEARLGVIDIITDGYEFTINVNQNDYSEAIEDVYFKTNGKSYNVLGQEVNDEYKGVIIRNGEKFIR